MVVAEVVVVAAVMVVVVVVDGLGRRGVARSPERESENFPFFNVSIFFFRHGGSYFFHI
jgi:hypothetical protein